MWIIEGLADDNIGFVAKMHHSTVDGVSGAELLSVLFDLDPDPALPPGAARARGRRAVPSGLELMAQATVARSMRPFEMTRDLVGAPASACSTCARCVSGRHRATRRPHSPCPPPGRRSTPPSPGADGGPLRHRPRRRQAGEAGHRDHGQRRRPGRRHRRPAPLLIDGDELPDKPLVAVVPVSVGPTSATRQGSNQVSAMFVHLPAKSRPDRPADGHPRGHQGGQGGTQRPGGRHVAELGRARHPQRLRQSAPAFYSAMRLANRHRPIANLVISNVPGPTSRSTWAGPSSRPASPSGR